MYLSILKRIAEATWGSFLDRHQPADLIGTRPADAVHGEFAGSCRASMVRKLHARAAS
jgi:hypothetical protein